MLLPEEDVEPAFEELEDDELLVPDEPEPKSNGASMFGHEVGVALLAGLIQAIH